MENNSNNAQNKIDNQEQVENLMGRLAVTDESQTEKIVNKLSANTYVPITVIVVVILVGIYIGTLTNKVDAMVDKDSPSRDEYNQMCNQLSTIQKGVESINNYLITGKKNN